MITINREIITYCNNIKTVDYQPVMTIHPAFILLSAESMTLPFKGLTVHGNGHVKGVKGSMRVPYKTHRRGGGYDYALKHQGRKYRVHRLVAHLFYGMPLRSRLQVNHLDKNTTNNRLSNLTIVTPKANCRHRDQQ